MLLSLSLAARRSYTAVAKLQPKLAKVRSISKDAIRPKAGLEVKERHRAKHTGCAKARASSELALPCKDTAIPKHRQTDKAAGLAKHAVAAHGAAIEHGAVVAKHAILTYDGQRWDLRISGNHTAIGNLPAAIGQHGAIDCRNQTAVRHLADQLAYRIYGLGMT